MQSNNLPKLPALKSMDLSAVEAYAQGILLGGKHLSYSSFSHFVTSPNDFIRYKLDKEYRETAAIIEGKLMHLMLLEPHNFDRDFVMPYEGKSPSTAQQAGFVELLGQGVEKVEAYAQVYSTKGKSEQKISSEADELYKSLEGYIAWFSSIGKRSIVTPKMYENAYRCAEAVMLNPAAKLLVEEVLRAGETEKAVEWEHKGYKWRGYLDAYVPDRFIFDLKKTVSAKPDKVRRNIKFEGWGEQSAMYSIAMDAFQIPYYMLVVDATYQVCVMEIPTAARVEKVQHLNWYIDRFTACLVDPALFFTSHDFYCRSSDGIYKF